MHPLPPALLSPSKSPVSFHSHGGTLWPRLPSRASSLQVPPSLCRDRERVPHRGAAWDPPSGANSCSPWESLIAPRCNSPPGRAAALYHAGVQTRRRVGLRAGTSPRLSPVPACSGLGVHCSARQPCAGMATILVCRRGSEAGHVETLQRPPDLTPAGRTREPTSSGPQPAAELEPGSPTPPAAGRGLRGPAGPGQAQGPGRNPL